MYCTAYLLFPQPTYPPNAASLPKTHFPVSPTTMVLNHLSRVIPTPLAGNLAYPSKWGKVFCEVIADTKLKAADQVHIFCLVCKEWREAALSTPRLWTDLRVGIGAQTTFSKPDT
ncbi:hypothetical protein FA13DRAFT_1128837 [Coprinellus micaceus]|uniref:Uncharacterized protein n=1 Tax=Coprinellus micaceus TaxID=71717 RepID=A0A4Y7RJ28_COPMI|nr:hypothetical protein FA13DRAFT_1128837 [Coprinellus micaceus]